MLEHEVQLDMFFSSLRAVLSSQLLCICLMKICVCAPVVTMFIIFLVIALRDN